MRLANATDHALLVHWRNHGDPAAFAALVDRHAAMVHSASMRVVRNRALAQEVAQDSFLKLTQLKRFDGECLGGWLHRVATNRALDIVKAESRRHTRETGYEASRGVAAPSSEAAAVLDEIDAAIATLPEALRDPIVLHYLEGRSHREIARALHVSRATITRRIHQGLDELRGRLGARAVTAGAATVLAAFEAARAEAAPATLIAALRKLALSGTASPLPLPARSIVTWPAAALVGAIAVLAIAFASWTLRPSPENTAAISARNAPTVSTASPIAPSQPIVMAVQQSTPPPAPTPAGPAPSDSLVLSCVAADSKPVEGAEVHLVRIEITADPTFAVAGHEDILNETVGIYTSDTQGQVLIPRVDQADDPGSSAFVHYQAFARVPGKLVGAWRFSPRHAPGIKDSYEWKQILMVPSMSISGTVKVPRGFEVTHVTVRLLSILIRDGKNRIGTGFSNASKFSESTIPPLAAKHPDPQGRFQFDDLPVEGNIYLAATAPGLGETQFFGFQKSDTEHPKIEMETESILFGTLRYQDSGAPAIDVPVFARPRGGPQTKIGVTSDFITRTDGSGKFRFIGLPADVYNLRVFPQGRPPTSVAAVKTGIELGTAQQKGPIDLSLERGGWVEGHVTNAATGEPLAGARLCALNPEDETWNEAIALVPTDANGFYRVLLPVGSSRLYFMELPPGVEYPSKEKGQKIATIKPDQREPLRIDFALDTGEAYKDPGRATVSGHVLNAAGKPQADVPIYDDFEYILGDKRQERPRLGATDERGNFRFLVEARGTHRLGIGGGGGGLRETELVRFSYVEKERFWPEKDKSYDFGESVVHEYTESLGGVVVDPDGNPVPATYLYLTAEISGFRGASALSDKSGAFTFKFVPKGQFKLTAAPDMLLRPNAAVPSRYRNTSIDVEPGFDYQVVLERKDPNEKTDR
jgi:RNA polymerase sigma factor (sigma-70 family)